MAEVLSPSMFSQNDPRPVLQARQSSSDAFQNGKPAQQHQPQSRVLQMPRGHLQHNSHGGGNMGSPSYRGTAAGPVSTYAFKTTPQLRHDNRSNSLSSAQPLGSESDSARNRQRYPPQSSPSTTNSSASSNNPPVLDQPLFTKDDSELFSNFQIAPFTATADGSLDLKTTAETVSKSSPDRYRKGGYRRSDSNGSVFSTQDPVTGAGVTASDGHGSQYQKMGQFFYNPPKPAGPSSGRSHAKLDSSVEEKHSVGQERRPASQQDTAETSPVQSPATDLPKRYRNRSSFVAAGAGAGAKGSMATGTSPESSPPNTSHDTRPSSSGSGGQQSFGNANSEKPTSPGRTNMTADSFRRVNNPSPLSRPMTAHDGSSPPYGSPSQVIQSTYNTNSTNSQSPAVAAMAALNLNDKESSKGMKSRLRRAFSFGSSAELKRVTENDAAADRAKARQEQFSNELDEEQDAIARQQEAAGLGNSIYSGQGNIFTGSTDNLSISSTASSASMMLRKMGKGMKKGGKSIKGLFRPKSVVGVPAADGPVQPSVAQISMVTVEAEREKVNVNANPHEQTGGGTGFPRLERNSLEVGRRSMASQADDDGHDPRRSILGNEHERADVLAAVKRGILKRSNTDSATADTLGTRHVDASNDLGNFSPGIERRGSPVPSTASSEPRRHKRTDSTTLEGDDYFSAATRFNGNQSTRSLPGTPRTMARNISFSPRIQFHDVWSSAEYDRRGDIATCNRLTPMLAQQIKEELNTFKMEMEVHELSKPHTHFF